MGQEGVHLILRQITEIVDLLDSARITGNDVGYVLTAHGCHSWEVEPIQGARGKTDFITVTLTGSHGKRGGGKAPTLGIVGRLGAIGARPEILGMISDADGAIVALSSALKLIDMVEQGDLPAGDIVVTTHLSPHSESPKDTRWGGPVRMAASPVDMAELLKRETTPEMDAILSIDATKGNRIINHRGFAISPTVKEGYILQPSGDLMDIMQAVTGRMPVVFPISTQDITPSQELRHINSIMTPSATTKAPVVGVALTAAVPVAGVATGANQPMDLEAAGRFCVEVAKAFGRAECSFYDPEEYQKLLSLYGSMQQLQTPGQTSTE